MHKNNLVKILDSKGDLLTYKDRADVDKKADILHSINILVFNKSNELILSVIPDRKDLPNIYTHRYGTTVATLVRKFEDSMAATIRCLNDELNLQFTPDNITILGEEYVELPDNIRRVLTPAYVKISKDKISFKEKDIEEAKYVDRASLENLLSDKARFADTFLHIWSNYNSEFPF